MPGRAVALAWGSPRRQRTPETSAPARRRFWRRVCAPTAALAAATVVVVALPGCGGGERPRGTPFTLDEATVARYVRYETGLAESDIDEDGLVQLRADLLGQILFARAAEREGLTVPAAALARETDRLANLLGAAAPAAEVLEGDARRRLLARRYDEQVVREAAAAGSAGSDMGGSATLEAAGSATSDGGGSAAPEEGPPEAAGGAVAPQVLRDVFAFRQIRCETVEDARRITRRLARGEAFEDLAREASTSPDRGRLLRRAAAELPEGVAEALRNARDGSAAGPVEAGGAYYVFALEGRVAVQDAPSARAGEWRLRNRRSAQDAARARRVAELARDEGLELPALAAPAEDPRP